MEFIIITEPVGCLADEGRIHTVEKVTVGGYKELAAYILGEDFQTKGEGEARYDLISILKEEVDLGIAALVRIDEYEVIWGVRG